jgi:ubiquinone/menaquinone biosynthesis C-methylase UbiE
MKSEEKYNIAYRDPSYRTTSASFHLSEIAMQKLKFDSVLEVGCGMGYGVIRFLQQNKKVKAIETCDYLLDSFLFSLVRLDVVTKGSAQSIPFPADTFDLVFCVEVLEHIPEADIHQAISEMVRVCKKYMFLTISTVPAKHFPSLNLHETIKPTEWWDDHFKAFRLKMTRKEVHPEGVLYVLKKY